MASKAVGLGWLCALALACGGEMFPAPGASGATVGLSTVVFSNRFDRISGLGGAWTVAHGTFITDGAAKGTAPSSYAAVLQQVSPDAVVRATMARPATTFVGLIARADPAAPDRDHYAAYIAPDGSLGLARRDGYVYSYLAKGPAVAGGSHVLLLRRYWRWTRDAVDPGGWWGDHSSHGFVGSSAGRRPGWDLRLQREGPTD